MTAGNLLRRRPEFKPAALAEPFAEVGDALLAQAGERFRSNGGWLDQDYKYHVSDGRSERSHNEVSHMVGGSCSWRVVHLFPPEFDAAISPR
jgi:hypothetical protein